MPRSDHSGIQEKVQKCNATQEDEWTREAKQKERHVRLYMLRGKAEESPNELKNSKLEELPRRQWPKWGQKERSRKIEKTLPSPAPPRVKCGFAL